MQRALQSPLAGLLGPALAGIVLLAGLPSAEAVIIASGDGSGNTTAPVDDPGFFNVGRPVATSGTYLGQNALGEHWVISTWHSGGGDITGGAFRFYTSGTPDYTVLEVHRLSNPDSSLADLKVFRISGAPSLQNLTISGATPAIGSDVLMVGRSVNRETTQTSWHDDLIDDSGSWPESPPASNPNRDGYKYATGLTLRWGTNQVVDDGDPDPGHQFILPDVGSGSTIGFGTVFDSGLPTAHEAQAATGDSGGAVYYKSGGQWQLAGIMVDAFGFNDQPNQTAVFGNASGIADLSVYRKQIVSITGVPEPSGIALAGLALGTLLLMTRRLRR